MPDKPGRMCTRCGYVVEARHRCGTTKERGYDSAYRRYRLWFLRANPLCTDCGKSANEVHHVRKISVAPELRLVPGNCMALCKSCHVIRTQRGE